MTLAQAPEEGIQVDLPDKLQCLFWETTTGEPGGIAPVRYRVLHGGRGGGKSWAVAQALLVKGLQTPLRILCARELQNSIDDSVHRVLVAQIQRLKLERYYMVQKDSILGSNGTVFRFEGIRHNIGRIRSFEGIDICWIEEAVKVTRSSWEILVPTIRREGSEIWLTFNPELETDYIYQEFVNSPPENAIVAQINWRDNPWFPQVLAAERDAMKARDLDAYLNVWEGNCRQMLDGAVYAQELRDAQEEKRLSSPVPYDPSVPVDVFFDLGRADSTAMWFAQKVGFQYRILRSFQSNQKHIGWYLKYIQKLEYVIGTLWLPHDAQAKTIGSELTVEEQARKHGFKVRIVPRTSVADGINAARTVFPMCWFDPKGTEEGLQALRHYRYDVDPNTRAFSKDPLHDQFSHYADAWRYLALALKAPKSVRTERALGLAKAGWDWVLEGTGTVGLDWMR